MNRRTDRAMASWAAWAEAERGRFFLLLPVAMATAILTYFTLPTEPALWTAPLILAIASTALAASRNRVDARFLAALSLAAALGFARAEWRTAGMPPLLTVARGATTLCGPIAAIDLLPTGRRITLTTPTANNIPQPRNIRIKLAPTDATPLTPGDTITLTALLFKPDRPAYPGGWDPGRDEFFQNLGASGFALNQTAITKHAPAHNIATQLRTLRENIATTILTTLPIATGSIAVTLLTGFQQDIPPQEHQNFITAGLAHLLAVAGLHVGIVMGLAFTVTRFSLSRFEKPTLQYPIKSIAAAASLTAGLTYAALTGAHLPILRSLAMASLVTLGIAIGRRAISLRGLAIAAMFIMLTTPEAVIGVSFQMSFSAVAALISGYAAAQKFFARMNDKDSRWRRLAGHIAALFYTSLLAGAASMPFAAYQFQQMQPYWIIANLIAVPLTALWVLPWGLVALPLMPIHLATLALIPMSWGLTIIITCANTIASWPNAMLRVPPMPKAAILIYAIALAIICIFRTPKLRLAAIPLMLAAALIYSTTPPPTALISPDAKLIAIRTPATILLIREKKASNFTLTEWQPVWPNQPFINYTTTPCATADACQIGPILLITTPPDTCPKSPIIIAPIPLRGACDAPNTTVIDRFSVWQNGATEIWLTKTGAAKILTDRDIQGARPWVQPWPNWQRANKHNFKLTDQK